MFAVRQTIDRSPFLFPKQARAFFEAMKATPEHPPFRFTDFFDDTRRIQCFIWQSRHPGLRMSPTGNPGLVGPQYSKPLLSSPILMLLSPIDPRQTVLFRNGRLDACDVTFISCSFQASLHDDNTPVEMYSELKVSKSTGNFRRPYECNKLSLLIL